MNKLFGFKIEPNLVFLRKSNLVLRKHDSVLRYKSQTHGSPCGVQILTGGGASETTTTNKQQLRTINRDHDKQAAAATHISNNTSLKLS